VTAVFLVSLAVVSVKKSHEFRLLLPTLACVGALCGAGWQWLFGAHLERRSVRALGAAVIVAGGVLGWLRLDELGSARFSGYWHAMDRVNRLAEESRGDRQGGGDYRVACAWHWAVFLRESAEVELVKLPHQLDRWPALDAELRGDDLEAIGSLDAFITHISVLLASPDLFGAVNERFEVDSVFYRRETFEDLGPIVVFRRRTGEPNARTFLARSSGAEAAELASRLGLQPGRTFGPDGESATLELVGWTYEPLPGDGHGWLELHWRRPPGAEPGEVLVRPRILTRLVELPWEEQHLLGRGVAPPSSWSEDEIVSEGWPVVAAVAPFDWTAPWRPLTGDRPPGTTFPGTLWLRVVPVGKDGAEGTPLAPVRGESSEEPDSRVDGFVRVGTLELIAPPR
jgi:hypothetical protein